MVTTKVINDTNGEYELKLVNQGAYPRLKKLEGNGDSYEIGCELNGTYREYWVGSNRAGDEITINSDQCWEYSEVVLRNSSIPNKAEIRTISRNWTEDKRDWTMLINKTGHKCRIYKLPKSTSANTNAGQQEIGVLTKEVGSRFFIFSDVPEDRNSFRQHQVVVELDGTKDPKSMSQHQGVVEHNDAKDPKSISQHPAIDISLQDCQDSKEIEIKVSHVVVSKILTNVPKRSLGNIFRGALSKFRK